PLADAPLPAVEAFACAAIPLLAFGFVCAAQAKHRTTESKEMPRRSRVAAPFIRLTRIGCLCLVVIAVSSPRIHFHTLSGASHMRCSRSSSAAILFRGSFLPPLLRNREQAIQEYAG